MCNRLNIRLLLVISCFQWFKDTKMKANHNSTEDGKMLHYVARCLKPKTGKTVKPYTKGSE